jgi:myo-inositol 2-dehydrogenase/D-chiro-inositol 1-dehydrogenase
MTNQVRVGVIGAGTLGTHHCHTLTQLTPAAHLVTIADLNEQAAQAAAALSPGTNATNDYRSLLDDPSIQAVVIVAPNDTHAQLITEAAEAKKDIFCEKPIALDLASADAALDAVAKYGVKLQIGFQRRFDRAYREAQHAIAAGDVGDVELVIGTTRDPAPPPDSYLEHSGSIFTDQAIHDYDSLRFLTGLEVASISTNAASLISSKNGAPFDTAITSLRMENGALVTITNSRRSNYGYDVRFELSGSKGMLSLGDARRSPIKTYTDAGVSHDFVGSYWELFEDAYVAEIRHFVDCVANNTEPLATGADGRKALEIALTAERSVSEGRVVSLENLV